MAGTNPTVQNPSTGNVGSVAGTESSLSNWAGDYVTDMLGQGQALGNMDYQAYMGPLTAGSSDLQNQVFQGLGNLVIPTDQMGTFTPGSFTDPGVAGRYMNPFVQQALDPQLEEARRQAEISRVNNASRLTQAGAYGGSRQAIMDSENYRNLGTLQDDITGKGWRDAYDKGANQFNTEQRLGLDSTNMNQNYGLEALQAQLAGGNIQRGIEGEGIAADKAQFEQERDHPYKQVQFMQSLLQGLPLEAQNNSFVEADFLSNLMGGAGGITSLFDLLSGIFKPKGSNTSPGTDGGTNPNSGGVTY